MKQQTELTQDMAGLFLIAAGFIDRTKDVGGYLHSAGTAKLQPYGIELTSHSTGETVTHPYGRSLDVMVNALAKAGFFTANQRQGETIEQTEARRRREIFNASVELIKQAMGIPSNTLPPDFYQNRTK